MTIADLQRGQRVLWRGETVIVVGTRGNEAQIARPGRGLRWVHVRQLEAI